MLPLQIEKHAVHILEQEASRGPSTSSRLSSEELVYAKEYADSMDSHMNSLVLRHMPSNFKKVDRKKAGILCVCVCVCVCVCTTGCCCYWWVMVVNTVCTQKYFRVHKVNNVRMYTSRADYVPW